MTTLQMKWNGLTKGSGTIEAGKMNVAVAIPEHFGGTGEGANPKELLAASAASCYLMTLAAMLQGHKIPATGITMSTELTGDKPSNMHIVHTVQVLLKDDAQPEDQQGAQDLIHNADRSCMIGNLLKETGVKITIEGNVNSTAALH
ncbi:osmotically inducible protein OsmC [Salmonella enterica]|uniref:OsmC family protein n=1 Tax=Atlantibacter hermannii TaxID=565 RepID=UPI001982864A|nr:osmotically inducible protein OsmC [Salmonella enterica]ELA1562109.1 OsmC family protein [Klebsiella pneumoniae]HAL0492507.1 osmotically inducible protein OsmC [Escherichia coli]EHF2823799.1 osmotically inducible protein OsmC [Salmonella enterica]EJW3741111.1 OsmC family protein [Salmonella enterica]